LSCPFVCSLVRSLAYVCTCPLVFLLHTFVHSSDDVNKFFHFSKKFTCRLELIGRKYSTGSNLSNNAKEFLNNPLPVFVRVRVRVRMRVWCVVRAHARMHARVRFVSKRARFNFKSQKRANYTTNTRS